MTATMLGDWEASNFAATGARISVVGVDEWTFRGDLMCHYASYYDSLDFARQLGILPAAASATERVMARLQHIRRACNAARHGVDECSDRSAIQTGSGQVELLPAALGSPAEVYDAGLEKDVAPAPRR